MSYEKDKKDKKDEEVGTIARVNRTSESAIDNKDNELELTYEGNILEDEDLRFTLTLGSTIICDLLIDPRKEFYFRDFFAPSQPREEEHEKGEGNYSNHSGVKRPIIIGEVDDDVQMDEEVQTGVGEGGPKDTEEKLKISLVPSPTSDSGPTKKPYIHVPKAEFHEKRCGKAWRTAYNLADTSVTILSGFFINEQFLDLIHVDKLLTILERPLGALGTAHGLLGMIRLGRSIRKSRTVIEKIRLRLKEIKKEKNPEKKVGPAKYKLLMLEEEHLELKRKRKLYDIKRNRIKFIVYATDFIFGLLLLIGIAPAGAPWVVILAPILNAFINAITNYTKREMAVSDTMLSALKRYRKQMGLSPFPLPGETLALVKKMVGQGSMTSTRQIRSIAQTCFDFTIDRLLKDGFSEDAEQMKAATVHWLRHTGISEDVKYRPREHVRDDAGHSSSMITDKYIDIDKRERHASARKKLIKPDL